MGDAKQLLHQAVSEALTELERRFKGDVELTFFARHKTDDKAHVLISNDSVAEIKKGLGELEQQVPG